MITKKEFGMRLAYYLEINHMSQTELAMRTGLTKGHISNMVNGRSLPTITTLRSLAEGLGIRPGQLIERREIV